MNRKTLLALVSFSAALVPAAAIGDGEHPSEIPVVEPATPTVEVRRTLDLAEARDTFQAGNTPTFQASPDNVTNPSRVTLYGLVFRACRSHFTITNTATAPTLRTKGWVGFQIEDPTGQGRECQHRLRSRNCSENESSETYCIRLHTLPEAVLDLRSAGDVDVGLIHHDPNQALNPTVAEPFDAAAPIHHKSGATLLAERREREATARQRLIDRYRGEVGCRGSADRITSAREALLGLQSLSALTEGEFERITRELDRAEVSLFSRRVARANEDELIELREELLAWAESHCELHDQIAPVFHEIALKYVNGRAATYRSYESAGATVSDAQSLECLSEPNQERLANYQRDIAVGRTAQLASNGMANNFLFVPNYMNLMNGLQNDVMNSCSGRFSSLESCSSAMTAMQTARSLPQRAQAVDQQRAQMQQQLQQALGGSGGMGMPPMTSGPGAGTYWAGGAYGSSSPSSGSGFF